LEWPVGHGGPFRGPDGVDRGQTRPPRLSLSSLATGGLARFGPTHWV
jgi:hypothetical protein